MRQNSIATRARGNFKRGFDRNNAILQKDTRRTPIEKYCSLSNEYETMTVIFDVPLDKL
jgi:hypothetical protein